jgi:cell division transport system ATP-binding protein
MISAKNLTLSYEKDKNIIENSNFEIEDKEFIVICGQSGSGKSTLLKSIYGKLEVTAGTLVVNNIDITQKKYEKTLKLRRNLGIVFQDYKLIPDYTVQENIKAPLRILKYEESLIDKQVENLLKHIKLSHKKDAYPEQLSGGGATKSSVSSCIGA